MKFIAMVLLSAAACAQDTRHVTEPKIPPACATLTAKLAAPAGVLGEADEGKEDTHRIPPSIDLVTPGNLSLHPAADGSIPTTSKCTPWLAGRASFFAKLTHYPAR